VQAPHIAPQTTQPITQEQDTAINLSNTPEEPAQEIYTEDRSVTQIGEALFFEDSISISGEGYSLQKHTDYAVVRILFDDDGKIVKVEHLSDLPWKKIDNSTIFLKRGANLTRISRHFSIPIAKLMDCNPQIKNPNKLQQLTKLKLNCQN